jgi:hypothetical protein
VESFLPTSAFVNRNSARRRDVRHGETENVPADIEVAYDDAAITIAAHFHFVWTGERHAFADGL